MIGYMNLAGMPGNDKMKYDIVAQSDGYMAILPFGEIK